MCIALPVKAQVQPEAPGSSTLGAELETLSGQLDKDIATSSDAAVGGTIQAARQVDFAIESARNAYQSGLNTPMDHADPKTYTTVTKLVSLVNDVTGGSYGTLDALGARTRDIVAAIHFTSHEPRVTRAEPAFVVPASTSYPVTLRFYGSFEFSGEEGFTPTLLVGDQRIQPSVSTLQMQEFTVPVLALVSPSAGTDPARFSYARVTLQIPWHAIGFATVFAKKRVDSYPLIVGALPPGPGKVTITFQAPQVVPVTKLFTSQDFYQSSGDDGQDVDRPNVAYVVHPDDGWHVVPGTSRLTASTHVGEWSDSFAGDSGNAVQYDVTTVHQELYGTSGKVTFSIAFTESQDAAAPPGSEVVSLAWGDSVARAYPPGTWHAVFDGFDGSHAAFTGTDLASRFITIKNEPGGFVIRAADPAAVVWP